MSMLTPQEIQEFKDITKKVKGIDLTDEEAEDQGSRLIRSFELILEQERKKSNKSQNID
jgi:hypothetical protein